jgi:hypothetical protein
MSSFSGIRVHKYNRRDCRYGIRRRRRLVIVEAEDGGTAKEAVVHIDVAGVVVRIRIPQAPRPHPKKSFLL